MDTTSNGSFGTAFLQGLAVVFFLYVLIFTVAIFKRHESDQNTAPLPAQSVEIARTAVSEPIPAPEPTPTLNPEDQVPAPEGEAVTDTPTPDAAVTAVNEELVEDTPQGPMPKRTPSGLTPFNAYKKSFTDQGKPAIALAVLDYGLSEENSKNALKKLPGEVSMILTPYAQNFDTWKGLAGAEGHEFWLQIPLENQIYPAREDPGPQALLVHTDFKYNQEKFVWALTRTTGYAGIASYTDAAFLNAQSTLKTLWDEGYNRGLGFFEINPAGLEGVEMNAAEKEAPYVRNNAIYDEAAQTPEQWLADLELEASNNGFAVGVIRNPYPQVVDSISIWASGLAGRGFELAPISALSQAKDGHAP